MVERSVTIEEFRKVIKEVVEEIVRKEILSLRISLLPFVSNKEQEEIERMFGEKPTEETEEIVVYEEDIKV